jgi:hypothetical protein
LIREGHRGQKADDRRQNPSRLLKGYPSSVICHLSSGNGPVVQRLERAAHNGVVGGSSPSGPTITSRALAASFIVFLLAGRPLPAQAGAAQSGSSTAAAPAEIPPAENEGGILTWLDPRTAPFIPIPEIGTDPNAGTSFGFLPVFLSTNVNHEIERIIAPDINYNAQLGVGANFRLFSYPSKDTEWYTQFGGKERIEHYLDVNYMTGLQRQQDWTVSGRLVYDRSASPRFYGFGNTTSVDEQSNYTNEQSFVDIRIGRNLNQEVQIAWDLRPRWIQIEQGRFPGVPSIQTVFPGVPGFGPRHEFLNRFFLTYDTRDSLDIPTRGSLFVAFAGTAQHSLLSSSSYSLFGIDLRQYDSIDDKSILAMHGAIRYTLADNNTPFWALASLGGNTSIPSEEQPLRGYGEGRFVDRHLFSADIELRRRVYSLDIFSTNLSIEIAPFLDTGKVFHSFANDVLDRLHVAGGFGFRAVASPFIVGYVDIGYGSEGAAVFSGLGYPF